MRGLAALAASTLLPACAWLGLSDDGWVRVVDEDGAPVEGAKVTATSSNKFVVGDRTRADGWARLAPSHDIPFVGVSRDGVTGGGRVGSWPVIVMLPRRDHGGPWLPSLFVPFDRISLSNGRSEAEVRELVLRYAPSTEDVGPDTDADPEALAHRPITGKVTIGLFPKWAMARAR